MRVVVAAISATKPPPNEKARIAELGAMEIVDGRPGAIVVFEALSKHGSQDAGTSGQNPCAQVLAFIGTSPLVVHDREQFTRLLRAECKRCGVTYTLKREHPTIDTWAIAKQRFPRQRHDLQAVMKKLGGAVPSVTDMRGGLHLQFEIATRFGLIERTDSPCAMEYPKEPAIGSQVPVQRTMQQRITLCWQILTGRA